MGVVAAYPWQRGIDCVTVLNDTSAAALKGAGAEFVARYLGHIDAGELEAILRAELAFTPIGGYGRIGEWSKSTGAADATFALDAVRALSLPLSESTRKLTIWLDLEGEGMSADDAIAYTNAWAQMIAAAGADPGLYVGAGVPLTAQQLYQLGVRAYWRSCSLVPEPSVGYQMIQLTPPNQQLAGVQVDFDVVQTDRAGRLPCMIDMLPF